ncbi:Variant-specific surface protein, partial [Giardia duodenalis]
VRGGLTRLMFPVIWCLIVNALAVACSGSQTNCATGMCETINGVEICTQCVEGYAPVNTGCTAHATANTNCKKKSADLTAQSQICEKCEGSYFLYKHGCYQVSSSLGTTLCALADGGVCTKGAPGYFALPGAAPTEESVAPCNATAEITLANGKKYTGVTSCTACNSPSAAGDNATPKAATCTACEATTPTYLKTVDGVTTCVPKSDCNNGFFVEENATPKKCTACNDNANCVACTGSSSNQCTRCKADGTKPYLKKEGETDAGSCVSSQDCATPKTHYIDDTVDPVNGKMCRTCVSGGATGCETCVKGDSGAICNTCPSTGNTIFGLSKKSCVSQCPTNSSKQNDTCVCNDGFTPNTDSSTCAATSSSVNLSTGAIAGISVAVIAVAGGLVGFLCWWFVCRGKA